LALDEEVRLSKHRDSIDFQTRWAVRPSDILQAFNELEPTVVFFNSCFSYNQAEACAGDISAAVGMNREIGDLAARVFAAQFYSGIGFGLSVPKAFAQAQAALMMEDMDQADIPEL
jgi:hypothetical protein